MRWRVALAGCVAAAVAAVPAVADAAPRVVAIDITGRTVLTTVASPTLVQDTGTVKGSPVGSGDITLNYRMVPSRGVATVTWIIRNTRGTLRGQAATNYVTNPVSWTFTGYGRITRGTGAYSGIRAYPYSFFAKHSKLGRHEVIRMQGTAQLPGRRR